MCKKKKKWDKLLYKWEEYTWSQIQDETHREEYMVQGRDRKEGGGAVLEIWRS